MLFGAVHRPCQYAAYAADLPDLRAVLHAVGLRIGGPCPYCRYPFLANHLVTDTTTVARLRAGEDDAPTASITDYSLDLMPISLDAINAHLHKLDGEPPVAYQRCADEPPPINMGTAEASLAAVFDRAEVLREYGCFGLARRRHDHVLDARLGRHGETHPDVLASRFALAAIAYDAGRLADARREHEQVLALRRHVLGDEHPATLTSRHALGEVARDQRNLPEARSHHEQTLADRRRLLGPEHPDTLTSMFALAATAHDEGDLSRVAQLLTPVLRLRSRMLGPDHYETLLALNNQGMLYQDLGDDIRSRECQERMFAAALRRLGSEHPLTRIGAHNLFFSRLHGGAETTAYDLLLHLAPLRDEDPDDLSPTLREIRRKLFGHPDPKSGVAKRREPSSGRRWRVFRGGA